MDEIQQSSSSLAMNDGVGRNFYIGDIADVMASSDPQDQRIATSVSAGNKPDVVHWPTD